MREPPLLYLVLRAAGNLLLAAAVWFAFYELVTLARNTTRRLRARLRESCEVWAASIDAALEDLAAAQTRIAELQAEKAKEKERADA